MLVVMAGNDPSAPGNVLWSNNQAVRNFRRIFLSVFLFYCCMSCCVIRYVALSFVRRFVVGSLGLVGIVTTAPLSLASCFHLPSPPPVAHNSKPPLSPSTLMSPLLFLLTLEFGQACKPVQPPTLLLI